MRKQLNYIDLFAGAGGLSEGFIKAGYNPIAHVEMDEAACYTLKTRTAYHHLKTTKNFEKYIDYLKEGARSELYKLIPDDKMNSVIKLELGDENNREIFRRIDIQLKNKEVDIIIGGPPCQAYSLVGRARSIDGMQSDPRNHLYMEYGKFLKKYNPKIFVFENVMGLRSANNGGYFKTIIDSFNKLGYDVADIDLNAVDFGVLQNRKRILLIGYKRELNLSIPEFKTKDKKQFLVQSVLQDLPKLQAGEGKDKNDRYSGETNDYLNNSQIRNGIDILTQHVSRPHTEQDKEIYRIAIEYLKDGERLNYASLPERLKTHKNQHSFFDRFRVVDQNSKYSQTVVAHISKDGHYYIHPDIDQNRFISLREAARLQSFPDDYYFEGGRTAAFKQIGNAVPQLMAAA